MVVAVGQGSLARWSADTDLSEALAHSCRREQVREVQAAGQILQGEEVLCVGVHTVEPAPEVERRPARAGRPGR